MVTTMATVVVLQAVHKPGHSRLLLGKVMVEALQAAPKLEQSQLLLDRVVTEALVDRAPRLVLNQRLLAKVVVMVE